MNDYSQGNKRKISLDIAKGIAILSVMMVHFPREYRLFSTGISYHVAIFFCVTGILLEKSVWSKEKIPKKEKQKRI